MKVYYGLIKPERISYVPRPDSLMKDVRLRKNIEQFDVEDDERDEEGNPTGEKTTHKEWRADEVYLLTDLTFEQIEDDFDNIYYNAGPQPTVAERLEIIEGLLGEIMEG